MFTSKATVSVVGGFWPHYGEKNESGQIQNTQAQSTPEDPKDEKLFEEFQAACCALGQALAESGHRILVCVSDWTPYTSSQVSHMGIPAAEFVIEGAERAQCTSHVKLYRPVKAIPDSLPANNALHPHREFQFVRLEEACIPWQPEQFPSVREADAIILISGNEGQELVACVAYHVKDEPVVAIPSFGGAAKKLYGAMLRTCYDLSESDPNFLEQSWASEQTGSTGTNQALQENVKRAYRVIKLAEKCHKRFLQQERRESWTVGRLAILCIGLAVLWAWLYTGLSVAGAQVPAPALTQPAAVAPFVNLWQWLIAGWTGFWLWLTQHGPTLFLWLAAFLAATLGLLLRTMVAYRAREIRRLDLLVLALDFAAATLLALGFCIFYVIGSWSFKGEVVPPQLSQSTALILTTFSLIGLAAGFLLPIEEFSKRLQQSISSN